MGLIGQKLVASLAADQHEVFILSRNPNRHDFPANVTGVVWDGRTAEGWGHLADGGEVADIVLGGRRAVPHHLQELGFQFNFPRLNAALTDLLGR